MSWPQTGYAPPPSRFTSLRTRMAALAGAVLLLSGAGAVGVALAAQTHAPQPGRSAAGKLRPAAHGPALPRSVPVAVDIPAIGVHSKLLRLGDNPDGTVAVPSLTTQANLAAWYRYSATPGQRGTSVIEGHVDTYRGPAVFFRLGALRPGNRVDVRLANGVTAVFRVTGVRLYRKSHFPVKTIYAPSKFASLHLITCGGAFDYATRSYLSNTVVFASLISSHQAHRHTAHTRHTGHAHARHPGHGHVRHAGHAHDKQAGKKPGERARKPRPRLPVSYPQTHLRGTP